MTSSWFFFSTHMQQCMDKHTSREVRLHCHNTDKILQSYIVFPQVSTNRLCFKYRFYSLMRCGSNVPACHVTFLGCMHKVRTNKRTTRISTIAPYFITRRPTPKLSKNTILVVFIQYRYNFTVHDGQIELFTVYLNPYPENVENMVSL